MEKKIDEKELQGGPKSGTPDLFCLITLVKVYQF